VNKIDRTVTFQIGLTIAVLVAIAVLIGYLSSSYTRNATEKVVGKISDADKLLLAANKRILPVGHVITQDMVDACIADPECENIFPEAPAVKEVVRTGAEVVDYLCASCHTAGVGGAPKLDDAADWGARYAQGMDALMDVGLNGKEGTTMMPKGGDTNLSDDDIWNSIVAMLKQAGVNISETERVAESNDATETSDNEMPATDEATEEIAIDAAQAKVDAAQAEAEVDAPDAMVKDAGDKMLRETGTKIKTMATTASDMVVDTVTIAEEPAVNAASQ